MAMRSWLESIVPQVSARRSHSFIVPSPLPPRGDTAFEMALQLRNWGLASAIGGRCRCAGGGGEEKEKEGKQAGSASASASGSGAEGPEGPAAAEGAAGAAQGDQSTP